MCEGLILPAKVTSSSRSGGNWDQMINVWSACRLEERQFCTGVE